MDGGEDSAERDAAFGEGLVGGEDTGGLARGADAADRVFDRGDHRGVS